MRTVLLMGAAAAAVAAAGCGFLSPKKATPSSGSTPTDTANPVGVGTSGAVGMAPSPGGAGFGAAQQVRQAVQKKAVTGNEMKNLHLFIETASLASGAMPSLQEITAGVQREDKKLAEMLADGSVILTGTKTRESCWAYEKDAATTGGWIVTPSGPERVDAATARRWISSR